MGVERVEESGSLVVLTDTIADAAAIGAYPHRALRVALDDDDIVAHQHLVASLRHPYGLIGELFVLIRQDEYTVGRSRPHVAFVVGLDGPHLHIGIFRIVLHAVLRMQEHRFAVLLRQHVHTAAVGCNPDVARLILHRHIGCIAAEALTVAFLVGEMLNGPAAAVGRHLIYAFVLRTEPVVSL